MNADRQKTSCGVIREDYPYRRWIGISALFAFVMILSIFILNHLSLWLIVLFGGMGIFLLYSLIITRGKEKKEMTKIDFLREQLARGDITHEQFVRMKDEIHNRQRDYVLIRQ